MCFDQSMFGLSASQSRRARSSNDMDDTEGDAHAFDLDAEVEPIPEATAASGLPGADDRDAVFGDDFTADDDDLGGEQSLVSADEFLCV